MPLDQPETDLSDKEVLLIEINGDQITASSKPITINQLTDVINDFTVEFSDKKVIKIVSTRDTGYDLHLRVIDLANATFDEHRNKLAQEKFSTEYSALSAQQKQEIDDTIPKNIIISEPQ